MYGEVVSTHWLTPQLVRVVLGGEGLADYTPTGHTDQYLNCLFLPAAATYGAPFDAEAAKQLDAEQRPRPRRISVRHWDAASGLLTIDIAAHGDVGHAGRWAQAAVPGDRLQMRGPAGGYAPASDVDAHLFVGDESALPAIAASIEQVPAERRVFAVLHVEDAAGEVELECAAELHVRWVHRQGSGAASAERLVDAVKALRLQELVSTGGLTVDAFVHGEASETREVRRHLLSDGLVVADRLSCSAYWRRGFDDEQWRSVKGAWNREVLLDVPLG